jgi:hypothetical protein
MEKAAPAWTRMSSGARDRAMAAELAEIKHMLCREHEKQQAWRQECDRKLLRVEAIAIFGAGMGVANWRGFAVYLRLHSSNAYVFISVTNLILVRHYMY